ncbi:MAG: DUF2878 domain-containing protein [Pseudomonadota bacterium]
MRRNFWINMLFFQLAWPACVVGAAYGQLWPSLLLVACFSVWQLQRERAHPADRWLVGLFAVTGLIVDTVWIQTGLLAYSAAGPWPSLTPIWLLALWVSLGLAVNHSLRYFREHWVQWGLLLCIASPFSYWMAKRIGAVEWLADDWIVLLALGPGWAVLVGGLFALANAMDQSVARPSSAFTTARERTTK